MAARQRALVVATRYEHMALRLLSALIQGWDAVPLATQGWILRDAALMVDGQADADAVDLPAQLLEFINLHEGQWT
jgi:hypothetical protein